MRSLLTGLIFIGLLACGGPDDQRGGVTLQLSASRTSFSVGDEIELDLTAVNASSQTATLYRPVYGSWEHARQPHYTLEFVDESGEVVRDVLGSVPGLWCGTMDVRQDADVIEVDSGESRSLGASSQAATLTVQPDARPGRYQMRIRYSAIGLEDSRPAELVSTTVPIEVTGVNDELWRCRQRQLADRRDHVYVDVSPARLVSRGTEGLLLVYRRYHHLVVDGEQTPFGEIVVQRTDVGGGPIGEPQVIVRADEAAGYVVTEPVPGGLIIAYTPGPVGGREVRVIHVQVEADRIQASRPTRLQAGPGNPYVMALARREDRVALVHHANDDDDGIIQVQLLDLRARPVGAPESISGSNEYSRIATVSATSSGYLLGWQESGRDGARAVLDRLDPTGDDLDQRYFDIGGNFVDVADSANAVHFVVQDTTGPSSSSDGGMGLVYRRLVAGRTTSTVALSPQDADDPHWGEVAWARDIMARLYQTEVDRGRRGAELHFGLGTSTATTTLSRSVNGSVVLHADQERFYAAWSDRRDDDSPSCREGSCVGDVWIAVLDRAGNVVLAPRRITHDTQPKPIRPASDDWQRFCP